MWQWIFKKIITGQHKKKIHADYQNQQIMSLQKTSVLNIIEKITYILQYHQNSQHINN